MSEHEGSDETPLCTRFSEEDMKHDHQEEIERLIKQMRDLSERELVDRPLSLRSLATACGSRTR